MKDHDESSAPNTLLQACETFNTTEGSRNRRVLGSRLRSTAFSRMNENSHDHKKAKARAASEEWIHGDLNVGYEVGGKSGKNEKFLEPKAGDLNLNFPLSAAL